jgi:ribosomal 50S subunit-associated protein YjgA (DUF615 family)
MAKEKYELNDHESSMKFKDLIKKEMDKDPLKKEICDKVDEFNKCDCPKTKDKLRKNIEKLDKLRRDRDLDSIR